jgi:hypothetical protein
MILIPPNSEEITAYTNSPLSGNPDATAVGVITTKSNSEEEEEGFRGLDV